MVNIHSDSSPTQSTFNRVFNQLPLEKWMHVAESASEQDFIRVSRKSEITMEDFPVLLSDAASRHLEQLCQSSARITRQRFGKVIRLFAPLYVSNECINNCQYCGFSRDNPIIRLTLSVDEVVREARQLASRGFRNILLVAGEHPKYVTNGYMEKCIRALREFIPTIGLEIGPMECEDYIPLVQAGSEGLVVYQETYDTAIYSRMHTAGPKKDFSWRLATPERAYQAGFRRIGIGALFGLADWRYEALALAAHAQFLMNRCWKSSLTVSFPRLRPCAGEFQPLTHLSDRHLVQLVAAFRHFLPDLGIVLSTREPAGLRNGLLPLGITHASAGSHTEPGGYTGAGKDNLHQTVRGRQVNLDTIPTSHTTSTTTATGQFDISDERSPEEIAAFIQSIGFEPVWKDWDFALGLE